MGGKSAAKGTRAGPSSGAGSPEVALERERVEAEVAVFATVTGPPVEEVHAGNKGRCADSGADGLTAHTHASDST